MAPKGKKGPRKKKKAASGAGGSPAVTPALDRGQLVGLRSRADLNGRRVEVREQAEGKDGAPQLAVRLLFGAGAGTVLKVKAANVDLDKDRALDDPAMATLVTAMQALAPGAVPEEERRDWAGLPVDLLVKIAETHIAQNEAGWAAWLKECGAPEEYIQEEMKEREREGNCLFVIAMVCKPWRKAQLKVKARLRSRVWTDVIVPGAVGLAKWALAEGCPKGKPTHKSDVPFNPSDWNIAQAAARYGHLEMVQWLITHQERDFTMDERMMTEAAGGGNLELLKWLLGKGCPFSGMVRAGAARAGHMEVLLWLQGLGLLNGPVFVADDPLNTFACTGAAEGGQLEILQWLRANGCAWDSQTSWWAVNKGDVEVLRWARENGCPWAPHTKKYAAEKFGYTDDFANFGGSGVVLIGGEV